MRGKPLGPAIRHEGLKFKVQGRVGRPLDRVIEDRGGANNGPLARPNLGTIAVNTYYIPYYTEIWVPNYGYGKALDTGAFRKYTNPDGSLVNQLDLFFNSRSEAIRWGRKRNVVVLVRLGKH